MTPAQIEAIKEAALQSAKSGVYQSATAQINGHTVSASVARGFRNTGSDSIRWKVDGKVTASAKLSAALA